MADAAATAAAGLRDRYDAVLGAFFQTERPKHAPQPVPESCLLIGPLEPSNEWYAIAQIADVKMCQACRRQYGFNAVTAMPTNLYEPGDNFDLQSSHVLSLPG